MSLAIKKEKPVILITGKLGQVGWELQRSLSFIGQLVACDREEMDLTNDDSIRQVIHRVKPDVIVNAAAYTAVDKAEQDSKLATQVNGRAPGIMAQEAKNIGALFIHYSTDYVFNGDKQGWYTEDDAPEPVNVYGQSKLEGENEIKKSAADYIILRTSWVYASRGHNFLRSMLKLAAERKELKIVDDQTGSPTPARLIADVTASIIWQSINRRQNNEFQSGLFNLVTTGSVSWYGFALKIVEYTKKHLSNIVLQVENIEPIPTSDYPTPAKRPVNSRLSVEKINQTFDLYLPDWDKQLELCIQEFEVA